MANDLGVWGVDSGGSLRLLIREGDTIGTAAVKPFTFLSNVPGSPAQARSFNNAAQMTARVIDTNSAQHIIQVDIP